VEGAVDVVLSLWDEARSAVGKRDIPVVALAGGFAGGRSPARQKEMEEVLAGRLGRMAAGSAPVVVVTHDAHAALIGAFGPDEPGCLLISGTGSICIIRSPGDQMVLAGGWGWPLGDEGSGAWVGMIAVRRVLGGLQRKEPDRLTDCVLSGLEIDPRGETIDADLMYAAANAATSPSRFAVLAPAVLELARAGDRQPGEIIAEAGLHLGLQVAEACEQSGWPSERALPTALSGGFGRAAADLLESSIRDGAGIYGESLEFVQPLLPPEGGAALLALQAAGLGLDRSVIERIGDSLS
jgi:glucosamine kinase